LSTPLRERWRYDNGMVRSDAVKCFAALFLSAFNMPLLAEKVPLPEGPGKAETVRVCNQCHGVEVAASRRESREGWNAIVADMVERGAQGTDDELGAIVEYLVTNFSKTSGGAKPVAVKIEITRVEINKAAASLLEKALALPAEQASAIVSYRDANGAFKSFDELAKVPGVDVSKLEAKKGILVF
jgi:competence protein ComEA